MNVVFDLGGVVFTWQPNQIIKSVFENHETQEKVRSEIFSHPDWVELDRGVLDRDDAIERGAMRTGLSRSELSELMLQIPHSLKPIMDTVRLVHSIKRSGNKVFVLSNMHLASIEHIEHEYSFWDIFDGIVISCRVHMVKPEAEIYEYLLNQYGLIADETIFIDDTDINLNAASMFGIKPIKFEDPYQCERKLKTIGCIE
jgi:putative hydrolase of the HAD superfamily